MSVPRSPVSQALGPWLEAIVARPVAVFVAPNAPPWSDARSRPFPYVILYSVPGGGYWGPPLRAPNGAASFIYQANAVALRGEQSEELGDAVRDAFLGRAPSGAFTHDPPALPGGWAVIDRDADGAPGATEYSGQPPKRVFTTSERYVIHVARS